eukprot:TRINITY_DN2892_c0_g2_i1.p2 TRINITY_DN2892_c0_g2~~TRINITY_DN2892_c0_g2_i1.p2  ORF type:complete len:278 (-),score=29.70 TRINITY_DN2892_c0_g2_i1:477-1310(-)
MHAPLYVNFPTQIQINTCFLKLQKSKRNKSSHVIRATDKPGFDSLDARSKLYQEGMKQGLDEDTLVAMQVGMDSEEQLTDVQQKYKGKIKEKLAERAQQLEEQQKRERPEYETGIKAYGRGRYKQSLQLFKMALDREGPFTKLGGEIQMWLALAYQAIGDEQECLEIYKNLETTHPIKSIQKQAANLRFILEAPKLEISEDEKVKLPVLTEIEKNARKEQQVRQRSPIKSSRKPINMSLEEKYLQNYKPPVWITNRYVQVATVIVSIGMLWYSIYRR